MHTIAFAQEEGERVIPLDSIVVLGTRPLPMGTVTRVSQEEIEEKNSSVAYDALRFETGLNMPQRLALTGTGLTRLTIRGAGSAGPAGLAVFIDGRPDPTVTFAHPVPQAHSVVGIEAIEVIYGPSPVLYGSGNTGVINITTQTPGPGFSGRFMASAGSHSTTENMGVFNYGWDSGYVSAEGTYRKSSGYIQDTDAWILGGRLKLGLDLGTNWKLKISGGQTKDHFAVFGGFFVPGPFGNPGTEDLDLTQTAGDIVLEGRIGNLDTSVQLWGDKLEPRSQVLREGVRRAKVSEVGTRVKASISPWQANKLTVGVDVLKASARNQPALPPTAPEFDESITEVGPYLFMEQAASVELTRFRGLSLTC